MSITGTLPLTIFQAGIESSPGTAVTATRKQPMQGGTLVQHDERQMPVEQRGSLIRNYRTFVTKEYVELTGMPAYPTFEDLPWFLNHFAHSTWNNALPDTKNGVPTNVTARKYSFAPAIGSDSLVTTTWEVGDQTQAYQVPFAVGAKMELGWSVGQPMTMTVDYLGKKATPVAFTSNLSDRVTEDINGALAAVYVDSTTIGSTPVTNVLDFKVTLDNHFTQFWALTGTINPQDVYRSESRSLVVEITAAFVNTTEFLAFQTNTSGLGTERKIRLQVTGSAIAGSVPAVSRTFNLDFYGYWQEAPFDSADGLHVVKFKGESVYDAAAGNDWSMYVINAVSPLP